MFFLDKICIKLSCKYIGVDRLGNKYYQSKRKDYLGSNKRYVIYETEDEPSRVVPAWHAWLHHTRDNAPEDDEKDFVWQQKYEPNHTGTELAYDPTQNVIVKTAKYIKWEPK
jgi:NADH:ubiquinone oxidoreductase subunit